MYCINFIWHFRQNSIILHQQQNSWDECITFYLPIFNQIVPLHCEQMRPECVRIRDTRNNCRDKHTGVLFSGGIRQACPFRMQTLFSLLTFLGNLFSPRQAKNNFSLQGHDSWLLTVRYQSTTSVTVKMYQCFCFVKITLTFCHERLVWVGFLIFHHPVLPSALLVLQSRLPLPPSHHSSIRSFYWSRCRIILFNMVSGRRHLSWQIHYWLALTAN